jgi:hypothetical protein
MRSPGCLCIRLCLSVHPSVSVHLSVHPRLIFEAYEITSLSVCLRFSRNLWFSVRFVLYKRKVGN